MFTILLGSPDLSQPLVWLGRVRFSQTEQQVLQQMLEKDSQVGKHSGIHAFDIYCKLG